MNFRLQFSTEAKDTLANLRGIDSKKYNKVMKTLGLMSANLRHPGLNSHKFEALSGPDGEDIFEAYVENKTPGAFRVFWYYGPGQGQIAVIAITPHL